MFGYLIKMHEHLVGTLTQPLIAMGRGWASIPLTFYCGEKLFI